jgi:hypothetical protein
VPNLARRKGKNQALMRAQAMLVMMSFILHNTIATPWSSRNKAYGSRQKGPSLVTCHLQACSWAQRAIWPFTKPHKQSSALLVRIKK